MDDARVMVMHSKQPCQNRGRDRNVSNLCVFFTGRVLLVDRMESEGCRFSFQYCILPVQALRLRLKNKKAEGETGNCSCCCFNIVDSQTCGSEDVLSYLN